MGDFVFSVVTPCFNSELYIAETIESVLSQSGPFRIQYIIVDGGSTDSTLQIIEGYQHRIKSGRYSGVNLGISLEVVSEPDQGMYDALTKGFSRVMGDVCSYINSDDFYLINAFRSIHSVFLHYEKMNWLTGIPNVYNSIGSNIKRATPFEYRRDFIRKGVYGRELGFVQQESIFWRSSLLKQIDTTRLGKFKFAGDFYLWHEFSKKNKLWIVDSIVSGFRTHPGNKSADLFSYKKEFDSIVSEAMSLKDKFDLFMHKRAWKQPEEQKAKLSQTFISLSDPKLQEKYRTLLGESGKPASEPSEYDTVPKHKPYISMVIGSFNRLEMLKICIAAVRDELQDKASEIIVVDGGSTDGTVEWLLKQKDIITIVQHNRGEWNGKPIERKPWAYFMNLAFKASSGKFVCMLSDDSLIIPSAINNGLALFEEQLSSGRKLGAVAFYFRDYPLRKKYAVAVNVGNLYVNHGLYLKTALDEAGYIDENYHFYFADTDLVLKIKEKGYECIASPTSYVEHYFEATPEIRASNNDTKKEQDRLRLINKWKGKAYPDEEYAKYLKTVGYWDYHTEDFVDEHNTIAKLMDAEND